VGFLPNLFFKLVSKGIFQSCLLGFIEYFKSGHGSWQRKGMKAITLVYHMGIMDKLSGGRKK
jgi:hypothetical protein